MNTAFRILAAGVLVGALAWLVFGKAVSNIDAPPARRAPPPANVNVADALAMPIFAGGPPGAPVSGPPQDLATPDPVNGLRLIGVILTPRRRAALISVGGAPPVWISQGETAANITVTGLTRNSAEVADGNGVRRLKLFQSSGPPAAPSPLPPPLANPSAPSPAGLPPASAPPAPAPVNPK